MGKTTPGRAAALFRRWGVDVAIAAALFAGGGALAAVYNATWGGAPQFWQNTTFMQGIMWVCGHGWHNPMVSDAPGLAGFLVNAEDCFDCGSIPEGIRTLPPGGAGMSFEEIDAFHPQEQFPGFLAWQRYHLYLVWAVTACWWLLGLCWSSLWPLIGGLYGATCALAYGIFRLAMRRSLALPCAILLLTAPLHLQMAPHLRDYAKAPFLLAMVFVIGVLLRWPLPRRETVLLCFAGGAAAGVGVGFRTDILAAVPVFAAAVAFGMPCGPGRDWARRALAIAAFAGAFSLTGLPVLIAVVEESGHFAHVTLLGLLAYCDQRLGVAAPLYDFGGPYTDFYMLAAVQAYSERVHGSLPPAWVMMAPYHEATNLYLREWLAVFPGDFVLRTGAAVLRVLDELHPDPGHPHPRGWEHPAIVQAYEWRNTFLTGLPGGGRHYAAAALGILALRSPRLAFGAFVTLMGIAGATALQFNLRHVFHLEFLWLLALGIVVQHAITAIHALRESIRAQQPLPALEAPGPHLKRLAVFAALAAGAYGGPLALGWAWQAHAAGALARDTLAAARSPVEAHAERLGPEHVRWRLPAFAAPVEGDGGPELGLEASLLAVEVGPGEGEASVTFRFHAENAEHWEFTRSLSVAPAAAPTWLFVPLYRNTENRFEGVEIAGDARRLAFYEVTGADQLRLWMTWRFPPDWGAVPLRQRLAR